MIKTSTKKALAFLTIAALSVNSAYATQVWTWSVTWTTSYDSIIDWDWSSPWSATGSVSGIAITASVLPILNMVISTGSINLGTLSSSTYSSWSLDIEIGTNAGMWVNVTAISGTGWLRSIANWSIINSLVDDWITESYIFSSALNAIPDSSITWYSQVANLNTEVTDNTTSHTLYQTTKPETSDWLNDVTFYVSAKVNEQTPAGSDYQDNVIITVVWNF